MEIVTSKNIAIRNLWYQKQIDQSERELELLSQKRKAVSLLRLIIDTLFFLKRSVEDDSQAYNLECGYVSIFDIIRAEKSYRLRNVFRNKYDRFTDDDLVGWLIYFEEGAQNHERKLIQRLRILKGIIKKNIGLLFKYVEEFTTSRSIVIKIYSERISDKSSNEDNLLVSKKFILTALLKHLNSLRNEFIRTKKISSKYRQGS
ncbi:MAG: hypothetical protein JST83_17720 [Bacteroidetes bacterium]|nr:hypothetical protein [Bacteroidota bacterium]